MKRAIKIILGLVGLFIIVTAGRFVVASFKQPSNNLDWKVNAKVEPHAEFNGERITIHDIRNFTYQGDVDHPVPAYYDKTFDLGELNAVWFGINPFGKFRGIVHTFVTFGFSTSTYVTVSVETRLENGQKYSPWTGLFNNYALIYQIGDENDIIRLRTNYQKDEKVYLYPVKTTPERMRKMFVAMVERANQLYEHPEFYNTITNNCTSNIVNHVNDLVPGRVPRWSPDILLPGYSDKLAYDLGLIDTTFPWEQVRQYYYVNDKVEGIGPEVDSADFSRRIRQDDNNDQSSQSEAGGQ